MIRTNPLYQADLTVQDEVRVAVFVDAFPKLSETFVIRHIISLIDAGMQVDIFSRCESHENIRHSLVDKYELADQTHYLTRGSIWHRWIDSARAFFLVAFRRPKALSAMGSRVPGLPRLELLRTLGAVVGDSRRYDVVHAHFGPNGILAARAMKLGAFPGARLITTFHGYDGTSYVRTNGVPVYAELFAFGDLFLAVGEYMKDRLVAMGCDAAKICVLPMGVDIPQERPKIRDSTRALKILTIGRLVEKKGHIYAIRAVARLVESYPGLEYWIIGDGPLRSAIEAEVRALGIASNVLFLGPRPSHEVEEALDQTDILLTPSVTAQDGDTEGNPVANMEAMAKQIPIVSSLHASIPELVEDGVSGYLCVERDVTAIAEALRRLLDDAGLRESFGRAGRASIIRSHNRPALDKRLIELYRNLRRPPSPPYALRG